MGGHNGKQTTAPEESPRRASESFIMTEGGRTRLSASREFAKTSNPPKPANRREHKKAAFVAGRTIGEKRERLETKRERAAARERDKRRNFWRITSVSLGFIALIGILIFLAATFFRQEPTPETITESKPAVTVSQPTIEIVDDSASATGGKITSRMREYIGMLESDLRGYNYTPTRAVIPVDSIREVHFYLDGYPGYLKTTIDRGAGVTAEDIDRMLRYLQGQGITEFEYIDVRIDGRAFWK